MKSVSRIPCTKCGAMILPATGKITGGICMPCKRAGELEDQAGQNRSDCLLNVPLRLAASKARYFQRVVLDQGRAAAEVLSELGLTTSDLRSRYLSEPKEFKLFLSDLSEEGVQHVSMLEAWWNNVGFLKDEELPQSFDFVVSLRERIERHKDGLAKPDASSKRRPAPPL